MCDAPTITFVLTSGGHNAGIISEPQDSRHTYQILTRDREEKYLDPDQWLEEAPVFKGSWWIPLQKWLVENSSGQTIPPAMGAPDKVCASLWMPRVLTFINCNVKLNRKYFRTTSHFIPIKEIPDLIRVV